MKNRIIFGSIMIVAIAALLWWDWRLEQNGFPIVGLPMAGLVVLLSAVGCQELARMAERAGLPVARVPGMVCAVAIGTWPVWRQALPPAWQDDPHTLLLTCGVVMIVLFFSQMAGHRIDQAIRRLAGSVLGVLYLGGLAGCLLALRVRFGLEMLAIVLAAVKFMDIGAYFTGKALGRHKMIPWLSPGKSWEGLVGGFVASAGMAMLLNWALSGAKSCSVSTWEAGLLGAVVGLVGQFGDLSESLLKRDAGVKDSGAIIPDFGGVLDIVDSPLVAAPVAYIMLLFMIK